MKDLKPLDIQLSEGVKREVVTDLYRRINELHTQVTEAHAHNYALNEHIEEIRTLALKAQPHVKEAQQIFSRIEELLKISNESSPDAYTVAKAVSEPKAIPDPKNTIVQHIPQAEQKHEVVSSEATASKAVPSTNIHTTQAVTTLLTTISLSNDKRLQPTIHPRGLNVGGDSIAVFYESDSMSQASSPVILSKPNGSNTPATNLTERYAFHAPSDSGVPEQPQEAFQIVSATPGSSTEQTTEDDHPRRKTTFGDDSKARADAYLQKFRVNSPVPQASVNARPSIATMLLEQPVRAPANLELGHQESNNVPAMLPSMPPPMSPSTVSTTIPIQAMNPTIFTRLPEDFDHSGTHGGTFYMDEEICQRANYNAEVIPVIRLRAIPKSIDLADILASVAGGPLYRVKVIATETTKDVSITFVHASHAAAFLEYGSEHDGILIRGCRVRTKVEEDWDTPKASLGYSVFRKMMTENTTRAIHIKGLANNFWNDQKLRELVVAGCDKMRTERPHSYRMENPHLNNDIVSVILRQNGKMTEAFVVMRNLSWGITAKDGLHTVKQPEGFYMERVLGEHGPSLGSSDDAHIPMMIVDYVRDPCDRPLESIARQ